jgi:hypothetical protein
MAPLPDLAARLNADIHDEDAWRELCLAAAAARDLPLVLNVLTARHQRRADGASFAYQRIFDLCRAEGGAGMVWLAEQAPRDSAFLPIFLYGRALVDAVAWRLDTGSAILRQAVFYAVQTVSSVFGTDRAFATDAIGRMLQHANLLEPSSYRPARRLEAPRLTLPEALPPGQGPLVLACCDETYLTAYGERFLASLGRSCPGVVALINRINPTEAGDALCRDLSARFAHAAFATEIAPAVPTYYACDRFLIAGAVIERYGRDLVLSDIDSEFPPRFGEVLEAAAAPSVAYIDRSAMIEPSLRIDASLMGIRADAAGRRFLDTVGDYLGGKLVEEMPLWTMDQVALFRARCLHPEVCVDLNGRLPSDLALPQLLKAPHLIPQTSRSGERGGDAQYDVRFDDQQRPLMIRRP